MIDTHTYVGLWWLPTDNAQPPSDAAERLSGTLTVTRGDAKLDVLGSFGHKVLSRSQKQVTMSPWPADQPRIHGITTKGTWVTLEACRSGGSEMHFPGIPTTTYEPRVVLLGAWFPKDEQIRLDEIAIRLSDLDTWVAVSGFAGQMGLAQQEGTGFVTPTGIDVQFKPPPAISIPLDNGEEARLEFGFEHSENRPVTTEVKITQRVSLHLRRAQPSGLDDVYKSVGQLRNFFSLAVGRPQTVLSVAGFKDDLFVRKTAMRQRIEMLWQIPHNPEPSGSRLLPHEMLFTLPEAQPSISAVMRAWIARQELLRPVFNLYFGMLYHPDMYRDVHFLTYAQAIETYDFRRRDATDLPPDEHEKRLAAILESSPDEHRRWLRVKLASGNRLTLRRRIRDVFDECPAVRDRIIGATGKERRRFISNFVDSRNYYTHYNPEGEKDAAVGAALYLLIVQLRAGIEMSLLRELGFSCEVVDAILDRVQRYAEIEHFKAIVAKQSTS
jgi:hypothetical protein